jgi:hypothetical protein
MTPVKAGSAAEALALLDQQARAGTPFELMLTDWCMPEMDGGQLLDALAADARFNDLAVIVLSSAGMAARPEVSERAPLLLKPVRQSELHNLIAQVLTGDLTRHANTYEPAANNSVPAKLSGRVLLAEDNPVNQEVASAMLQRLGVTMKIANNGSEAVDLCREETFDLVLMDCQMPLMDGFEATASIRHYEAELGLPAIPIIALTANAISGDREHCLERGMSDYLSKPFAQQQLYELLARWLPARGALLAQASATPDFQGGADTAPVQSAVNSSGLPITSVEIDQQVIRQLRELREGLLPRIVGLFRSSSPPLLAQLETAVANNDADLLYKTAHNLKNSAANLGLIELAAACRDCEAKARQGTMAQAEQQLRGIQTLYGLSLQALLELEQGEQGE